MATDERAAVQKKWEILQQGWSDAEPAKLVVPMKFANVVMLVSCTFLSEQPQGRKRAPQAISSQLRCKRQTCKTMFEHPLRDINTTEKHMC
jgi:hypothetical protein